MKANATTMERCEARSPGGITDYGQLPKKGVQCGLHKGHSGDHCVIIPTGYPWSYEAPKRKPSNG